MNPIKFDIFVPSHSHGLMVDARVLKKAIGEKRTRIVCLPAQAYQKSSDENVQPSQFEPFGESAIFVENVFDHPVLQHYQRVIFVPNPEWCTSKVTLNAQNGVTEFWHKTQFGMDIFKKLFPGKPHHLIGFTSFALKDSALNFESWGHFSGKSKTRHTQELMDIWLENPAFPPLKVHFYDKNIDVPEWIPFKNLKLRMGFMNTPELQEVVSQTGIHLCTSQMEGFGHYINEARALGALIIALDAPPMNELIDAHSGILVQPVRYQKHNQGVQFIASKTGLQSAIETALGLSEKEKAALGQNAKARYFSERETFLMAIQSLTT